ncbi:MAG: type II toxin-antitoxin system PemK/MazF family toxin [Candidatus Sericytochromatia bacterium]|nr:type II toxin-antitoxin system PemK/MazF family toxin [Candidatus Sericytochromatia bacterium]
MSLKRGEIWLASLDPTKGSEQAGTRPIIIFQNESISKYTITVISIPLTTNLKRASLPTCVLILKNGNSIKNDSVALCHQMRVLDKTRLLHKIGELEPEILSNIDKCVIFTLGIINL